MWAKFVRLELPEKILPLEKHGDMILNYMTQTREKRDCHVFSRPNFWMVWRCLGITCVHFIFCLEVRNRYLDESDFRHCYGNFFVSAILKVTFSTIARHIDNSILKNTRELPILQTWINIGANSFIKTWRCLKNHQLKKDTTPPKSIAPK